MCGDITERADAEHAPDIDQIAVAGDAAERRHRQRHPEKHQRPKPGAMNEVVDRPRAMDDTRSVEAGFGERHQQQSERSDA